MMIFPLESFGDVVSGKIPIVCCKTRITLKVGRAGQVQEFIGRGGVAFPANEFP